MVDIERINTTEKINQKEYLETIRQKFAETRNIKDMRKEIARLLKINKSMGVSKHTLERMATELIDVMPSDLKSEMAIFARNYIEK